MVENNVAFTKLEADPNDIVAFASYRARRSYTYELVLKLYGAFGLLTTIIGSLYFIFVTFHIYIGIKQQMALIVAVSGLIISTVAWAMLALRRQREVYETGKIREYAYMAELVETWATFEDVSRKFLDSRGEDRNQYSPRAIIASLRQGGSIDDVDAKLLQEALELRNMAVHGGGRFPSDLVAKIATALGNINARLGAASTKLR